jgi:predicted RNase H-like nuclease
MTEKATRSRWLAGVDGCAAGWLLALLRPDTGELAIRLLWGFRDMVGLAEAPRIVALDIPIGLPERAGRGGRAAEQAVRPLLGARQSSVFSVPARAAFEAPDYASACRVAFRLSDPPRKVSRQLFMIAPKIREVDAVLRSAPEWAQRVYEVHPELAFWRLNGDRPLNEPKKVRGRCYGPGLDLRRGLLLAAGLPAAAVAATPPRGAGPDDLLDALACVAIAQRIDAGLARPFPDPPPRDRYGLPMAIWA